MVAPALAPDPPQRLHLPLAMERLGRAMCLSLTATMFLVAAWLCVRRLAGEMSQPLGLVALLSVGAILASIVSAVRCVGIGGGSSAESQSQRMAMLRVLPGFATMLIAIALTLPGTSFAAAAALWSCVAINEGCWIGFWIWYGRRDRVTHLPVDSAPARSDTAPAHVTSPLVEDELPERVADPLDEGDLQLPNEVSQQITRTQAGAHGDTLAGLLRAVFLPGERSRYLHVAICPPMSGRPEVEVVQLSGPSTRVKAAEIQSFGVRFDLRLVAASTREETVLIHFEACCPD